MLQHIAGIVMLLQVMEACSKNFGANYTFCNNCNTCDNLQPFFANLAVKLMDRIQKSGSMDKLADDLVDKMFGRVLTSSSSDNKNMDSATLKKPAHLEVPSIQRDSEGHIQRDAEGQCQNCEEFTNLLLEPIPIAPNRKLADDVRSHGKGGREVNSLLRHHGPHSRAPYAKEMRLLAHVLSHATKGNPPSIVHAIEDFGEESLSNTGAWLKIAGDAKAEVLATSIKKAPQRGSLLEIGTYCGYSAIRMAMACPNVRVISLEADPAHMVIARNIIAFAGLDEVIDVWTGHSKDLLHRIHFCYKGYNRLRFQGIFKDASGAQYIEDVEELEDMGLTDKDLVRHADAEKIVIAEKVWW
eukprot:gnl/MRDRNA2_/MRDRNA2_30746_c0_seq1.p1 gnl/MRDRNA2_/MRDRNA2_30746_c0~~gnl/MRDRNA2_/MRDRNA2_30746_c0_seq1.p1  ORF type:complete len:355 (+),score=66.14 gnl/MRDRNA2_/MRDRNA2_30746_c0_seq1:109-1173(+)